MNIIRGNMARYNQYRRSQCPRGLRRGCAGARLLRLWVRIPPGHGCLLWVLSCQEEVSASGRSLVQRSPTKCAVSECDRESSIMRPWPAGSWCAMVKKSIPVSKGLSIRQYSPFDQLSSNTFRPKLDQLQALKIRNTLRKTFNWQRGAITITTRSLAVGSHKTRWNTLNKNSSSRQEINKIYTDNCTEFTIHRHDGVPHTTQVNGVWLIQQTKQKIKLYIYIYIYIYIGSR
jgi:hypothetical protein